MHMADGLVSVPVAATMYGATALAAAYSIKKIKEDEDFSKKIPIMGVMGAFVFAAQMINFSIPGTGSSGHLCGGLLLSAVLGPYAGFISMIGVLLIQCLLFADGGLLALGANIWNMAFYGCFIGSIIWRVINRKTMNKKTIFIASILGSVLTLQLGALSVCIETALSHITTLPFSAFIMVMLPIHLAIGAVEGLITGVVLCFLYDTREELITDNLTNKKSILSVKQVLAVLTCAFLVIGGGISLLASSDPDGLEWSISQLTGDTEVESNSKAQETASKVQETTSLLPDYSFKDSETLLGTSVSGIVGCIVTVTLLTVVGKLVKKKTSHEHS